MTLTFARKVAGVHTCQITDTRELAVTGSGSAGWSLVVRDVQTRKIAKRVANNMATLTEAKKFANTLANSPKFGAFLLSIG